MIAVKSTKKQKGVQMGYLREKAQRLGVEPGNMGKTEMIHAIQRAENCTACFGTAKGDCQYTDCCFMSDCLGTGA